MEPITTTTDNSASSDDDFAISVKLSSELIEHFEQKLEKINHLAVRQRLVYVYLMVQSVFVCSKKVSKCIESQLNIEH